MKSIATIGIGMAGYGSIGKIHTLGYRELPLLYPGTLPKIELAAVCTSRSDTARSAAELGGYDSWCTDVKELAQLEKVTVVDCAVPNYLHREALLAAFAAGKHAYCEKPLALNGNEARLLVQEARKAKVTAGMTFNFRFIPALMRAQALIREGALGRIYSFRGEYLHTGYQDPERLMSWRLRKERSGGGALVDMGSHVIDLIRHLLGEFASVQATTQTYVKERPAERGSIRKEPVTVDDAAWLEVRLKNGAIGTIEVSRFATGALDDLSLEVWGEKAALRFHLMDANWLYWFDAARSGSPMGGERGWTRLETVQHYPGATLPPPRSFLGWTRTHAENQYRFLRALTEGNTPEPDIVDGLKAQLVLDAAYSSAEKGGWVQVPEE